MNTTILTILLCAAGQTATLGKPASPPVSRVKPAARVQEQVDAFDTIGTVKAIAALASRPAADTFDTIGSIPAANHLVIVSPQRPGGYPLRGPSATYRWPYPNMTLALAVRHMQEGDHAGLFDPAWLAARNFDELTALHLDHHEGRMQWEHVKRPAAAPDRAQVTAPRLQLNYQTYSTQNCPGGYCPAPAGLFRRRR